PSGRERACFGSAASRRSTSPRGRSWFPTTSRRRRTSSTDRARAEHQRSRRYALLEAPSSLGLEPHGVERLPERLLELGLESRTNAHRAGRVAPPPYTPHRDETTRTLNAHALATWSPRLADAVESI